MVPSPSDRPPSAGFFKLRNLPPEELGPRTRPGQTVARVRPVVQRPEGQAQAKASDSKRPALRFRASTAPARSLSPQLTAGTRAARIIADLALCGPSSEQLHLGALRALGNVGLEALTRAFPGSLWFDRNDEYQREPRGRDVSPIASLLHALAPASHPYVIRLLVDADDDVRFYATLLAADLGDASMIEHLHERIFDPDCAVARNAARGIVAIGGDAATKALVTRLERLLHDQSRDAVEQSRAGELLAVVRP